MSELSFQSLTNHFLLAMPELKDPNFNQAVTLICQHDANGALGVVVNRPLDNLIVNDVLNQFDLPPPKDSPTGLYPVYAGGPVHHELGLVLHEGLGEWQSTLEVGGRIGLTSSRDVLEAISKAAGPPALLLTLGYAGWGPGQLEKELQENAWLTVEADPDILFRVPPPERWQRAAQSIGVDITRLAPGAGHA